MSLKHIDEDRPADALPTDKEMGSWFGMLDDASKAEVMKAKIAADADVKKAELASENFQLASIFRRVVPWVAAVIITLFASCTAQCTASSWENVQKARVAPCPACSACPSPAASK